MPTIRQSSKMQQADKEARPSVALPDIVPSQPCLPNVSDIFFLTVLGSDGVMNVMADLVEKHFGQLRLAKPIGARQPASSPSIQNVVYEDFDPSTALLSSGMIEAPSLFDSDLSAPRLRSGGPSGS